MEYSTSVRKRKRLKGSKTDVVVNKAFGDADTAFALDKNCQDFFTKGNATPEQVKTIRNLLSTLRDNAQFEETDRARASVGSIKQHCHQNTSCVLS